MAADDQLDVSDLTCEQFANYDNDNKGLIDVVRGPSTSAKGPAHLAKLLVACQADPDQKVLDLTDDPMEDWTCPWIFSHAA